MLEAIKAIINTNVTAAGYVTKFNTMPDQPKNVVVVRDTGGVEPDPNFTAYKMQHKTFQILVRSDTYTSARDMADTVRDLLHGYQGTQAGVDLMFVMVFSEPQPITNETGNYEFSANYRVKLRDA